MIYNKQKGSISLMLLEKTSVSKESSCIFITYTYNNYSIILVLIGTTTNNYYIIEDRTLYIY